MKGVKGRESIKSEKKERDSRSGSLSEWLDASCQKLEISTIIDNTNRLIRRAKVEVDDTSRDKRCSPILGDLTFSVEVIHLDPL